MTEELGGSIDFNKQPQVQVKGEPYIPSARGKEMTLLEEKRNKKETHFPRNDGYYLAARNISVAHLWIYGLSETRDLTFRVTESLPRGLN